MPLGPDTRPARDQDFEVHRGIIPDVNRKRKIGFGWQPKPTGSAAANPSCGGLAAHSTVLRAGSVLPEEILSTLISSGWKRVPGDQLPSEPTMFSTMRSVRAEIVKKAFTSSADRMIDPSAT